MQAWNIVLISGAALAIEGCAVAAGAIAVNALPLVLNEYTYNAIFRTPMVNPDSLTPQEKEKLSLVRAYASTEGLTYTAKGDVRGLSCKLYAPVFHPVFHWAPRSKESEDASPEDIALTQLKIKAVRVGANVLISPSCAHRDAVDWVNNCWDSWECSGQAVEVLTGRDVTGHPHGFGGSKP